MSKYTVVQKLYSGPVAGLVFYPKTNFTIDNKVVLKHAHPPFTFGYLIRKTAVFPSVAVIKLVKLQKNGDDKKYRPLRVLAAMGVFEDVLLRIELLPPVREVRDRGKLPYLVLYSHYPLEVEVPQVSYRFESPRFSGDFREVAVVHKCTRECGRATDIHVLIAKLPLRIEKHIHGRTPTSGEFREVIAEEVNADD